MSESPHTPTAKGPKTSVDAQEILEHAPIGIFTSTPEGRFLSANSMTAQMLGYDTAQELIDSVTDIAWQVYADPADRESFKRLMEEQHTARNLEYRLKRKNGTTVWASVNAHAVRDAKGDIAYFQVFWTDINERKKAEQKLRESEKRFRFALETCRIGTWELDISGLCAHRCILHDNIFGYKKLLSEWSYPLFIEHVHPDDRDHVDEKFRKALETKQDWSFECRIIRADGQVRWIWAAGRHAADESGALTRLAGIVQDITERKQVAEAEALRGSEELFRHMFMHAPVPYLSLDEQGIVLDANQTSLDVLGYTREELIGKDVKNILPSAGGDRFAKYFSQLKAGEETSNMELEIVRRDGASIVGHFNARVHFDDQGQFQRMHCVFQDITERKSAEGRIREVNRQLQKANAEKDRLFAIIAHDLKSPMSGLLTSTAMLADEIDMFTEQDIRTLAAELHKNAKNTYALLEDLLQWARMSQGGVDYAPAPCSLKELISISLRSAQDEAKRKDIVIFCDIPREVTVCVDQPMVNTVVRNILFNAIKFTPRGGTIAISAEQTKQNVTVTVQDTGVGMDDGMTSSLFTLEKEKGHLGTEGEKGTGLGLVLCKQFIDRHGGQIWIESAPGQGTTVFFTLPASE